MSNGARWLAVCVCGLMWFGCGGAQQKPGAVVDGRQTMDLQVDLTLEHSDLVIGEDTPCTLVLTNVSSSALTIPDPEQNNRWPRMHIVDTVQKTEAHFGPFDVGRKDAGEFNVPLPEGTVSLPPNQPVRIESSLLRRVEIERYGKYELSAKYGYDGNEVVSKALTVSVHPLALRSAAVVGAHSGHSPYRYCLWSQRKDGGSVLLFTGVTFDQHGRPTATQSLRLTELDHPAEPVISVSPNKQPYPSQWVAWLAADKLHALYLTHGRLELTAKPQSLDVAAVSIIAPILNEPSKTDASQPGRADVALWAPTDGRNRLVVRTLEPDGALSDGPEFDLDSGDLEWARAATLADGRRRVVLLVQRNATAVFEYVQWIGGAASGDPVQPIADLDGSVIGSGMTLDSDDRLRGATVLASKTKKRQSCVLRVWRIDADGQASTGLGVPIVAEADLEFDRALVESSPEGNVVALLHSTDGRWFACNSQGRCQPLPDQLEQFGEPVGAFWLHEASPFLLMAGAETGITYQSLRLP